jgi:hypothetical protein
MKRLIAVLALPMGFMAVAVGGHIPGASAAGTPPKSPITGISTGTAPAGSSAHRGKPG